MEVRQEDTRGTAALRGSWQQPLIAESAIAEVQYRFNCA